MPVKSVVLFAFLLGTLIPIKVEAKPLRLANLDLKAVPWGAPVTRIEIPPDFDFRHCERDDAFAWQGKINGQSAVVVCAFTHRTKLLYEVSCIIGEGSDLSEALLSYNTFKNKLKHLYGRPSHSYNFTYLPFTKGIGYDNLALKQGKYNISDFWAKFTDTFIGMTITPEGWTCITFESKKFSPVATKEFNETP